MINIGTSGVSDIFIGNSSVGNIYFGNDLIWSSGDEFVATMLASQPDGSYSGSVVPKNKYNVAFDITTGNKGCVITFNGNTQNVAANTTQTVVFSSDTQVQADLTIKGGFTDIVPYYVPRSPNQRNGAVCFRIKQIKKWYKKIDKLLNSMFNGYVIDFDIELPNNIKYLNNNMSSSNETNSSFYYPLLSGSPRLVITNNLEEFYSFGCRDDFFSNATNNGDVWSIGSYVMAVYNTSAISRTDTFVIPSGTTKLASGLFSNTTAGGGNQYLLTGIQFPNDNLITEIPENFLSMCKSIASITIPSNVVKIGKKAFSNVNASPLTEITFSQPSNTIIDFPLAGSTNGFIYYKSATTKNIYTANNQSVMNYDWAADNVTPTFYKLDRTTEITRLSTPIITLSGTTLNISGDANSSVYEVRVGSTALANSPVTFTTSLTSLDLSNYVDLSATGTYTITVRALSTSTYAASLRSAAETYTVGE